MRQLFRHAAITQMQNYGNIALVQRKFFCPSGTTKKRTTTVILSCRGTVTRTQDPLVPNQMR